MTIYWKPTPKQNKLLQAAQTPGNKYTITAMCEKAGITRDTFYRWRKEDDNFRDAWNEIWYWSIEQHMPSIVAAQVEKAMSGDTHAANYLTNLSAKMISPSKVQDLRIKKEKEGHEYISTNQEPSIAVKLEEYLEQAEYFTLLREEIEELEEDGEDRPDQEDMQEMKEIGRDLIQHLQQLFGLEDEKDQEEDIQPHNLPPTLEPQTYGRDIEEFPKKTDQAAVKIIAEDQLPDTSNFSQRGDSHKDLNESQKSHQAVPPLNSQDSHTPEEPLSGSVIDPYHPNIRPKRKRRPPPLIVNNYD